MRVCVLAVVIQAVHVVRLFITRYACFHVPVAGYRNQIIDMMMGWMLLLLLFLGKIACNKRIPLAAFFVCGKCVWDEHALGDQ